MVAPGNTEQRAVAYDCTHVHAQVRQGRAHEDPTVAEHLEHCEPCAVLVADGGALGRALDGDPSESTVSPPGDFEALWARVHGDLEAERGPLAWLRSRPTSVRLVVAVAAAALVLLFGGLVIGRPDLAVYPGGRLLLDVVLVVGALGAALWVGLRPLHRPASPPGLVLGAIAVVVLAALAGPLLPVAHQAHPASLAGVGADFVPRATACFFVGSALALPVLAVLAMLARRSRTLGLPSALAVVGAGVVGAGAVFLHCPLVGPSHLLAGHSTVVALFLAIAGVTTLLARRRRAA